MHGGEPVHEILYGTDGQNLFVRVDTDGDTRFGIEFENGPAEIKMAAHQIVEMSTPLAGDKFRVTVARDGLPPLRIPAESWIALP